MSQIKANSNDVNGSFDADRQREIVWRAVAKGSFCTLATSSAENRPHVAGVVYAEADGDLYVSTLENSIKARNIRHNPRVAVCIPVRRYPFGPPYTVQFQGTARLVSSQDPQLVRLAEAGRLKAITSHGEFDLPGGCFIQVTPARRAASHGLGVPLLDVIRDPISAGRSVELR